MGKTAKHLHEEVTFAIFLGTYGFGRTESFFIWAFSAQ
jgi:hypothetical protein